MNKELPKMYQTKINKVVPSIQKVYSTLDTKDDLMKRQKQGGHLQTKERGPRRNQIS